MMRLLRIVVLTAGMLSTFVVAAGSYSVYPVTLGLSDARPATTLKVRNSAAAPVTLQLAVKQWQQPDGEDDLQETRDIIAVPPVFTIAAGGEQIVRVGLRKRDTVGREQAYRLLVKEIPSENGVGQGLKLALNMSLPVFVLPERPVSAELAWQVRQRDDGQLSLSVANPGDAHFKFTEWRLLAKGSVIAAGEKLRYVLPGARREWSTQPSRPLAKGDKLHIVTVSAGREQRTSAVVE